MADATALRIHSGTDEVAVRLVDGADPAVLWLGGFRSDMSGGKATALAAWGREQGRKVVLFDYRGHGASGGVFEAFAVSDWLADAGRVRERFCSGPTVAVGSSMGGWVALLLARALCEAGRPLAGLVLIAPATDFTERLMWPQFPPELRRQVMEEGTGWIPSEYGGPYPVTRRLFEDGRRHLLYTDRPIRTGCPVHILQGVRDTAVPYRHALELVERLAHDDVVFTLVKDGDHRLSRPQDIARLLAAVEGIAR